MEENKIRIHDEETGQDIDILNGNFYGPVIATQKEQYIEQGCVVTIGGTNPRNLEFHIPATPTTPYELEMWDAIDAFEKRAWSAKNVGLKTGWSKIDDAFNGGLFPGFIIIAGDSNIGKSGFISQLAWQVSQNNGNDVYVMDFSLDDAMPDKLARIVACSGRLAINAVKNPLTYTNYPLMLIRRKKTILKLRENVDKYHAYSADFSTYIEDIEKEIQEKLVYFKSNNIYKKLVICIDNFHDLNIASAPNLSDKEKYDRIAQWCADVSIRYDIVVIASAELKKLNGTRPPQLDDIRESVKIKYEAKAILLVYNEVHYKAEGADVFYMKSGSPFKQPVFEVHFAKNKFHNYKGKMFFEFYPEMAHFVQCTDATQKNYANLRFN